MADSTSFDSASIKRSADNLGKIMDNMSPFTDLENQHPNSGKFTTAQWLEKVVDDRRNAIVEHANRLKTTLGDLKDGLHTVADKFTDTDGSNAAAVKSQIDGIRGKVAGDIDDHDNKTEADQHNFSDAPNAASDNGTDGDGYNDTLPKPTGSPS